MSALPPIAVRPAAFGVSWELPTEGHLGELLTMKLRVCNQSREMRALKLNFSDNDAFLFCGLKVFHFRLPPDFSHNLQFNLLPIRTGTVNLPTPRLLCVTSGAEIVDPNAHHSIFVRPSERTGSPTQEEGDDVVTQSA